MWPVPNIVRQGKYGELKGWGTKKKATVDTGLTIYIYI